MKKTVENILEIPEDSIEFRLTKFAFLSAFPGHCLITDNINKPDIRFEYKELNQSTGDQSISYGFDSLKIIYIVMSSKTSDIEYMALPIGIKTTSPGKNSGIDYYNKILNKFIRVDCFKNPDISDEEIMLKLAVYNI